MGDSLKAILTSTELLAAVVGAIVGGAIALALQLVALREARDARREEYTLRNQALGNALIIKTMRIWSDVVNTGEQFSIDAAEKSEPWQTHQPVANVPQLVQFSTEELSLVISLKKYDLLNDLMNMESGHGTILALLSAFNQSSFQLRDSIAANARLVMEDGQKFTNEVASDGLAKLRPKMIEVNSLIQLIAMQSSSMAKQFEETTHCLRDVLNSKGIADYRIAPNDKV